MLYNNNINYNNRGMVPRMEFVSNIINNDRDYERKSVLFKQMIIRLLKTGVDRINEGVKYNKTYTCTMRGADMSLTFGIETSKVNKAQENIFVCNSDVTNDLGDILDERFFQVNPNVATEISTSICRPLGLGNYSDSAKNASLAIREFMTMVSRFVDEVSAFIVNSGGLLNNNGRLVVTADLNRIMEAGFDFLGLRILPTLTNNNIIVFNYTFDELLTNSLKLDQNYFG